MADRAEVVEIYAHAIKLAHTLNQTVGRKNDCYVTLEQLEHILKSAHAPTPEGQWSRRRLSPRITVQNADRGSVRAAALEEAARVADGIVEIYCGPKQCGKEIAAAIQRLIEEG